MAIQSGFLFPHDDSGNAPSSGDGGPGGPAPSGELSTVGGLDSELSRSRGSEADYRRAQAMSTGEHAGGSAGFGLAGPVDDEFHLTGGDFVHGDDTAAGYGIAGEDRLVRRTVTGDNNPDSNATAGGKAIG